MGLRNTINERMYKMKKLSVLLAILFVVLSFSTVVSAAEREDITINGIHSHNDSIVTDKNGYTMIINKSIDKIESNEYIDIKVTLKSIKNNIPKTGAADNMMPMIAMLIIGGGFIILLRKKSGKVFLSLALIIALLPATMTIHAKSANSVYATIENFSDETLKGFTFDKIISISKGNSAIIEDDSGEVRGIEWNLEDATSEQSLVYRLFLNENVPDDLVDQEINVSSANLDFTDSDGNVTSIAYPDVSVELKETTVSVPPSTQFTLTYTANSGDGNDIMLQQTTGSAVTVSDNEFTKTDHTFLHWNTAADDSGTSYQPGETFEMPAENVILYAQWEFNPPVTYSVTYDANGGTGTHKDENINSGDSYTVKDASDIGVDLPVGNLRFWNTELDGSGITYYPDDTIIITSDVVLYAQWQVDIPPDD